MLGSLLDPVRGAMRRERKTGRCMAAICLGALTVGTGVANGQTSGGSPSRTVAGAEVSGVVRMPEICSPSVSPAVVYLVPADAKERRASASKSSSSAGTQVTLVNQRGLQFTPRVQAIALGQTVRFTNQDGETHNVHVVSPGFSFNQSMTPGRYQDFTPERRG